MIQKLNVESLVGCLMWYKRFLICDSFFYRWSKFVLNKVNNYIVTRCFGNKPGDGEKILSPTRSVVLIVLILTH